MQACSLSRDRLCRLHLTLELLPPSSLVNSNAQANFVDFALMIDGPTVHDADVSDTIGLAATSISVDPAKVRSRSIPS